MELIIQGIPEEFCLACKGCCRFSQPQSVWIPRLLQEEVPVLQKINIILLPNQTTEYYCEFLDTTTNQCRIYKQRPFDCQLYPFVLLGKDNKVFLAVDPQCLFVQQFGGRLEFEAFSRQLLHYLNTRLLKEIIRRNPQVVQDYPNVKVIGEIIF
ncbi:MAG: YkgJ family cysteine cluster protein [Candidatus Omnitrophica bacterium]|nr:YkgJ family cysteine cluster protein [Candidatus Omnitrophota bacterium]